ncbi:hypothetical protein [uncultured Aquimarina sp.]|uniref:hypothetical protein n=1 Tax=uncultured Aquimarina sp. TaxID=575652 RepID=UPI002635C525|nr:hypothetical protein [uncultured Aquimarina sp.]
MAVPLILISLFIIAIYILLLPIVICLDTNTNEYYIQLKGLAKASIEEDKEEVIRIKLRMLFFNFHFFPLKKVGLGRKKTVKKKSTKKPKNRINIRTGLRLLNSFKVKKILLDIDTGDCIYNAKLYPVFAFLKYYTKGSFNINFNGRNEMALYIQNRPIYIIKSFINS